MRVSSTSTGTQIVCTRIFCKKKRGRKQKCGLDDGEAFASDSVDNRLHRNVGYADKLALGAISRNVYGELIFIHEES